MTGARQPEFDIPGNGTDPDLTYSWTGDTGITLDSTLTQLLFSARFRDFDLLISDQITADSQLLFHRTISERLPRIAPFLRYDKDPYLVVDDRGHLVYIQDAYTISDHFPHATWFNTLELASESGLSRRRSQLPAQQRQGHDGRLRRHDDLLRRRRRPIR